MKQYNFSIVKSNQILFYIWNVITVPGVASVPPITLSVSVTSSMVWLAVGSIASLSVDSVRPQLFIRATPSSKD